MVLEKAWQFFVKSYYKIITNDDHSFPWWMAKHVEGESSFKGGVFLLGLQLREILILDALKRRNICLVNWCCLCQCSEESVDHLLIHCTQVSSLCSLVFFLFGVSWVIPKHMVELLACWKGGFGCYLAADIWWAIPLCLMWTIGESRTCVPLRRRSIPSWIWKDFSPFHCAIGCLWDLILSFLLMLIFWIYAL